MRYTKWQFFVFKHISKCICEIFMSKNKLNFILNRMCTSANIFVYSFFKCFKAGFCIMESFDRFMKGFCRIIGQ